MYAASEFRSGGRGHGFSHRRESRSAEYFPPCTFAYCMESMQAGMKSLGVINEDEMAFGKREGGGRERNSFSRSSVSRSTTARTK